MEKIKILRIIARLNIGGPAINAILLTSGLNKDKFDTKLITGVLNEAEGDMSFLAKSENVEPLVIATLGREINFIDDLKTIAALYKIFRKERPQIVHTHTAKAGTVGRIAAILAGVPVRIHTFHGHVFHSYFGKFKTRIFIFIERFLANFTSRVIVISQRQLQEISGQFKIVPANKTQVIELGFDLSKFLSVKGRTGLLRDKLNIGADEILIAIIGRLVEIKNHRLFFDAAKLVISAQPGIKLRFIVVGDGHLRQELEAYSANIGIGANVKFLGWRTDLDVVYSDVDIVSLTSLNEGTPVSLIEAMACAKPVVATNVGGVRDVVEEGRTGFLVKSGDVDAFAGKLKELILDSAKRAVFGSNARIAVKDRYSKDRLIRDTEALYMSEIEKLKSKGWHL